MCLFICTRNPIFFRFLICSIYNFYVICEL
nr:MAG TPA: hypothetical protein [Crassvirales sp.]DAS01662.1 MAG TPA: hypothetical protein [Caudoviricetes sp.]